MNEIREELGFGRITTFEISHPTQPVAIESKFNISDVLDVPVNSVRRFEERRRGRDRQGTSEPAGGRAT
jgi:hypothetical protein